MQWRLLSNPLLPVVAIVKHAAGVEQCLVVCQASACECPCHEYIRLLDLREFLAGEAALDTILSCLDHGIDRWHDSFIGNRLQHVTDDQCRSELLKRLALVRISNQPYHRMLSST